MYGSAEDHIEWIKDELEYIEKWLDEFFEKQLEGFESFEELPEERQEAYNYKKRMYTELLRSINEATVEALKLICKNEKDTGEKYRDICVFLEEVGELR